MTASRVRGRGKSHRPEPPDEVQFPVTPMLDMAFQLLAFFVLTFQAPSGETHLDLDLPAAPLALPSEATGKAQPPPARRVDTDLKDPRGFDRRRQKRGDRDERARHERCEPASRRARAREPPARR